MGCSAVQAGRRIGQIARSHCDLNPGYKSHVRVAVVVSTSAPEGISRLQLNQPGSRPLEVPVWYFEIHPLATTILTARVPPRACIQRRERRLGPVVRTTRVSEQRAGSTAVLEKITCTRKAVRLSFQI